MAYKQEYKEHKLLERMTGLVAIVLGALMMVGAVGTWFTVADTLEEQSITVAGDAEFFAGETVNGPLDAYAQAQVIDKHALDATDGKTYAELERDDPLRNVAMNASFLRASLFTSVVAFGLSALAGAVGVLFVLIGLGIRANTEN